jgi:pyruvate/oxaloacetate carboxyltransferase
MWGSISRFTGLDNTYQAPAGNLDAQLKRKPSSLSMKRIETPRKLNEVLQHVEDVREEVGYQECVLVNLQSQLSLNL